MANSYISVTYNGSNNVITLPFSYLQKTHLHLYKNDVERPYAEMSFNSAGTIVTVTTSLTVGDIITIIRQTPITAPWVTYSTDLGSLSTTSLNETNKHNLYAVQEARDYADSAVAGTLAQVQAVKDEMDAALVAAYDVLVAYAEDCSTSLTGAQAAQAAAEAAQAAAELAAASIVFPTSAQILTGLLTVDGSGSGLDADLLDGHEASYFATDANLLAHTGATAAHSATSSNTASRIVTRDASGNFSAGTITATLSGNATSATSATSATTAGTATTLATTRTLNVSGDVTGTAQNFNGSANVSIPTTLAASTVLSKLVTVDGAGSGLDADLLDGNEATAFATAAHNHTGTYQPKVYTGTVATAAATAAKTCTISEYTSAAVGDLFAITFTLGNTAAAMTLNINGIDAVPLRMNGLATSAVTTTLAANAILLLYFDGTYLQLMGSQRTSDSDTYDRMNYNSTVVMGAALYDYKLCLQAPDGKFYPITLETGTGTTKTVSTVEFNPNALMLHYASAADVASGGSPAASTMHTTFNTSSAYYLNAATLTAGLPVYLKGTITSAGLFKLDNSTYTSFFTQTLPTSDDGYVYWYIGQAYTTHIRMTEVHPMLYYKAGKLRVWSGVDAAMILSELKTVDGVGSGLDADLLQGYTLADLVTYMATYYAPLTHVSDTAAPHGATSTNTASRIVTRNASGDFSAHIITANLTGSATSATFALQMLNARTFNLSGAVTGTAQSYDGTANVVIPTTITSPVNADITRTTNITLTANTATCTLQTDGVLALTGASCQLKGDNSATTKGAGALRVSSATSGTTGVTASMSSPTRATDTLNLNCSWSTFTDGNYLCFYMGNTEVARIKQGKVIS